MLERERQRIILSLVEDRSVISVMEMVDLLGASEATIRRDISAMSERGEIRRVRGGAEALVPRHQVHLGTSHFETEELVCFEEKRAIARAAAALVKDGDSIIINGGTTTFRMVEFLKERNLDILTNSFPIAAMMSQTSRHRVTIPGGTIYPQQGIVLSPFPSDMTRHFWGRILFTGCHGLNSAGLMETDPLIAQAEMRLLESAEQIVILADSRKLKRNSAMVVAPLSRIARVITDTGVSQEALAMLHAAGIATVVVEPDPVELESTNRPQIRAV
ncbi:DeoR/GlpR family DNA-binding transcription regulator [Acidocella sp.]|uniref:DeoR/GlpR family DNA-binding transcription regulator n=1 Tax=Acidocella sp. TaxID=50710 RepID=UPI001801BEB2|nr:DeoR/GlpR family DNA-binding transcription regulator [Acidocella sp.]NNM56770.1 DeoR/GlpR transcriptional regulator [Acidocella sp.]